MAVTATHQIAGVDCAVSTQVSFGSEAGFWSRFTCPEPRPPVFVLSGLSASQLYYGMEIYEPETAPGHVLRCQTDWMLVNRDWTSAELLAPEDCQSIQAFTVQLFHTHAVQRQMIQLHASIIGTLGRGVLFLGPSGIGKTTQAERWAEHRAASIINGDIVFVQQTAEGFLGWGTPWHGSSPYCLNTSVPVKALVVLRQARENRLQELTGFEKVREVSGSVFYPTWLENGMELCTDTLNHMLTDLPVYRLDNRADEAAVNLLAAELDRIT